MSFRDGLLTLHARAASDSRLLNRRGCNPSDVEGRMKLAPLTAEV